jgi:hypothetical protein
LLPCGRQLGREAVTSRSLVQIKIWCSKRGILKVGFFPPEKDAQVRPGNSVPGRGFLRQ